MEDMNLKGVDLNVAVNAVIGSMVTHGYLDDLDNAILVTVSNDSISKASALRSSVVNDIQSSLEENQVTGARLIVAVLPQPSLPEPPDAGGTVCESGDRASVQIAALVGTPGNEAGTPFHTGVKSVPRPVRLTAYITYLRQGNRYDLVVAISDTVKHLRP